MTGPVQRTLANELYLLYETDKRTLHFLNRCYTSQGPEVRISDPRKLLFDGLEEIACGFQTGIGTFT